MTVAVSSRQCDDIFIHAFDRVLTRFNLCRLNWMRCGFVRNNYEWIFSWLNSLCVCAVFSIWPRIETTSWMRRVFEWNWNSVDCGARKESNKPVFILHSMITNKRTSNAYAFKATSLIFVRKFRWRNHSNRTWMRFINSRHKSTTIEESRLELSPRQQCDRLSPAMANHRMHNFECVVSSTRAYGPLQQNMQSACK